MKSLFAGKKATALGLGLFLAPLGLALQAVSDSDPATVAEWSAVMVGAAAFAQALFSNFNKKSA